MAVLVGLWCGSAAALLSISLGSHGQGADGSVTLQLPKLPDPEVEQGALQCVEKGDTRVALHVAQTHERGVCINFDKLPQGCPSRRELLLTGAAPTAGHVAGMPGHQPHQLLPLPLAQLLPLRAGQHMMPTATVAAATLGAAASAGTAAKSSKRSCASSGTATASFSSVTTTCPGEWGATLQW